MKIGRITVRNIIEKFIQNYQLETISYLPFTNIELVKHYIFGYFSIWLYENLRSGVLYIKFGTIIYFSTPAIHDYYFIWPIHEYVLYEIMKEFRLFLDHETLETAKYHENYSITVINKIMNIIVENKGSDGTIGTRYGLK